MQSIHDRLRGETRELHRATERLVPVMGAAVTVEDYGWFVGKLWGFHAAVEPALARLLPDVAPGRRKTALLAADAAALGLPDVALPAQPPALQTRDQAFGCLYVLEGSTLGGLVIREHLQRRLPAVVEQAARYLGCHGRETRRHWTEFCLTLEAHVREGGSADDVVNSACATFRSLQDWLRA